MVCAEDAPKAVVRTEVVRREVCYCGICGRRMVRFKTAVEREADFRVVYWRCPACMGAARTGRTVEISREYRRR